MGECEGMREKCLTLDLCMLIDRGKITKLRTLSHWMDDPVVGHIFGQSLQENLRKMCNTPVWCLPKTL